MNNPYQAPESPIIAEKTLDGIAFYTISKKKFWILQLCTLGLYIVGWAYQNWRHIKMSNDSRIWPLPRAVFMVFFTHSLMKRVKAASDANGIFTHFNYSRAATIAVVVFVVNYTIDRLTNSGIGGRILGMISLGMVAVIGMAVWPMQNAINHVSGDHEGLNNDRLSTHNLIWIVIGLILWGFLLYGMLGLQK